MKIFTKSSYWLVMGLAIVSSAATAQERKPAEMLKPEQAGILLMEARFALEEPTKTLNYMGLKDGDIVADIGCGNGWYSLQVAERIGPRGVVLSVDVQQGMLDQLIERKAEADVKNVHPILGEFEDPMLPPGKVDWILLVDAYHEFSNPEAMLARMKESLAPGGRVMLLEYRAEQDPATIAFPIPRDHKMSVEEVMREWEPAGFELVTLAEFLPAQHSFVFKVKGDNTRRDIRPISVSDTINTTHYDSKVFFAGQPSEKGIAEYAAMGVKTVINLRAESELASRDFDEKSIAEEAGMQYIHIPMGRSLPEGEQLNKLVAALDLHTDAPVLLHCASSNRVGAVWSYYAGLRGGLDADTAVAEGNAAGMRAEALETSAREALGKQR